MQLPPHKCLTAGQVSARWGLPVEKVWRWLRTGRLPAQRLGHVYLISVADVLEIEARGGIPRRDAIMPISLHR